MIPGFYFKQLKEVEGIYRFAILSEYHYRYVIITYKNTRKDIIMKYFFRNLSYSKQILVLFLICVLLSLYSGYQNAETRAIIIGVFLPVYILIFSVFLNKIVEANKMYVDLKLYNYYQMKKLIDIEEYQKHNFKIFTDKNKINKKLVFIAIENTGNTLISAVEVIINRKSPKKDSYYYLNTPLVPGNKKYIAIDYNKNPIKDILLITYQNNTDKLHYFNSKKYNKDFTYFKDHSNQIKKYNHRKISPRNKIKLYEEYIKL